MRRVLAGVAALTIALTIGFAVSAYAAPPDFGGMNAQWVFWGPRTSWDSNLGQMEALGVKTVRFDATWATVEPTPPVLGNHIYLWSSLDDVATAIAQHHMRWQPILSYSAAWASKQPGTTLAPPNDPADFAAFAKAFAQRYGPNGAFWRAHPELQQLPVRSYEIWNEENLYVYWKPAPDAAAYADLYAAARDAIHSVDPTGQVVVGGLANVVDPPKYVEAMLAHRPDLRGHLDAVAFHAYATDANAAMAAVVRLRLGLQYLGSGDAPIIVSEFGWTTTGPNAVSDVWRAGQTAQLTRDLARSDCNVSAVQLHTWLRLTSNQSDPEDGFAIVRTDGSHTQTADDYLRAIRDVAAATVGAPGTLQNCWPSGPPPTTTTPTPPPPPAVTPAPPPAPAPSGGNPDVPGSSGETPPPAVANPPAPSAPTGAPAPRSTPSGASGSCTKATKKTKAKKRKRKAKRSSCTKKKKAKKHKRRSRKH